MTRSFRSRCTQSTLWPLRPFSLPTASLTSPVIFSLHLVRASVQTHTLFSVFCSLILRVLTVPSVSEMSAVPPKARDAEAAQLASHRLQEYAFVTLAESLQLED